jgi:phytoene dehydrogenase-like protein
LDFGVLVVVGILNEHRFYPYTDTPLYVLYSKIMSFPPYLTAVVGIIIFLSSRNDQTSCVSALVVPTKSIVFGRWNHEYHQMRKIDQLCMHSAFRTNHDKKRNPMCESTRHGSLLVCAMAKHASDTVPEDAVDVIVIGSGLAGLSCAALLAHCNKNVAVLESHDAPGGCAHTWERRGFHFESGPSLYSGFSMDRSPNPLKNIFQIVEEDCDWITYDRWGTVLPNGKKFAAKIGPEEFGDVLREHGGPNAEKEFATLMARMKPLSDAAQALSSMALREDPAVALTLLRYPKEIAMTLSQGSQLTNPFAKIMEELDIKDSFVKNWLDMLCFLLQGLPASGTLNTVMAYMLADWYRPGVTLDFPRGGSGAIVDALVRAVRKHPMCTVSLNSHVDEIIVEGGKAVGVRLMGGKVVRAKQAIVSNADPYITNQLLWKARESGLISDSMKQFMDKLTSTDPTNGGMSDLRSFIHLHAGIDGTGLPTQPSADFPAQWAVIRNWDGPLGVEDPRNIVLCSIPSMLDPAMAPDGKHVIHAYTPATEPCTYMLASCKRRFVFILPRDLYSSLSCLFLVA